MVEFATYIEQRWGIPYDIAENICHHYQDNDSKYFLSHYVPFIAAQVDFDTVSEVYRFLDKQKELASLREKTITILKKADIFDEDAEANVKLSITATELEDLSIAHRTSVRTRGNIAIAKGLEPLADIIDAQEAGEDVSKLAEDYIENDESFTTADDVLGAVTDILAERYGYEEEARIIVREYVEDEGFIELYHKKKTKKYDAFNEPVAIHDLTNEQVLFLRDGEEKKDIKIKIGIHLFQISELLREHFLENSDCAGASVILDAINDAWNRLLQPMVEEAIKEHLISDAEDALAREIKEQLRPTVNEYVSGGKQTMLIAAAYEEGEIELMAIDNNGQLLRSTQEPVREFGRSFVSGKIKQLFELYHPAKVAIFNNKFGPNTLEVVEQTMTVLISKPEIVTIPGTTKITTLQKSTYLKESFVGLSDSALKTFAYGLTALMPFNILMEIGTECFHLHEKQEVIGEVRMNALVEELYTSAALLRGVEIGKKNDYLLKHVGLTEEQLLMLRKARKDKRIKSKEALASVEEFTEAMYHNIAGYIVLPESTFVLDKSTIHPKLFDLVHSICQELKMTLEELLKNLDRVESFEADDEFVEQFIRTNVAEELKVALRYQSLSDRPKRRLRLDEIRPDAIMDGKVTNITQFGVFIDINAFSDGLVHISELANEYVESAEQVVQVGDSVKVKVIDVNRKKRRISLSMKQADNGQRRVRASRSQINDLVNFFKA